MHEHPKLTVILVAEKGYANLAPFAAYLKALRHVRLEVAEHLPRRTSQPIGPPSPPAPARAGRRKNA